MPSRLWRFRLQDILDAIGRIQSYTNGLTLDELSANRMAVDAIERNFILIGEAAGHVPEHVTSRLTAVPWRNMQAMRNRAVHHYWGVDLRLMWETIQDDLPAPIPLLQAVLESKDIPE